MSKNMRAVGATLALCCFANLWAQHKDFANYDAFLEEAQPVHQRLQIPMGYEALVPSQDRLQMETRLGVPTILWAGADLPLNRAASRTAEDIARDALALYAPLYRLQREHLQTAQIKYIHDIGRGPIIAKFKQVIDGYEVYGTAMNVAMDRQLRVHGLTGYLFPHAVDSAVTAFALDYQDAMAFAFNDMEGLPLDLATVVPGEWQEEYQNFTLNGSLPNGRAMVSPARVRRMIYGMADRFLPAYYVELNLGDKHVNDSDSLAYVISAEDGRVLMRRNLTVYENYTYRVWANGLSGLWLPWDGPQGNAGSPHPTGTTNGFQQPFQAAQLRTLEAAFGTDPWLPPASTQTVGNNVDAYIDRFGGDGYQPASGDFRAATTSASTFDHTFDHATNPQSSNASQQAAVVQLFYLNNYLHDRYYLSGFNEAAGNAQQNNYGRGGLGNDSIKAEGQDGSGTNNANMSTPADGAQPRMQMYIFTSPNPDRDGTIDNGIAGHEWGHYIHHRLVSAGTQQSGAMSEGWGDIIALMLSVEEGDNYEGVYATGAYATYQGFGVTSFVDNFYFGIRRFPYSTDFSKNGLTFKHISVGPLPSTPISPLAAVLSPSLPEVHNAGEVWATMWWECYHDLIESELTKRGTSFDAVQQQMQDYLVASMMLSPAGTTFTEARDALLLAASTVNPDHFNIFANAFAIRGCGQGAVSPDRASTTLTGVVESYVPVYGHRLGYDSVSLDDSVENCDNDGVLDVGETGLLHVRLVNTGFLALNGTTATVTSTEDVSFANGGALTFPPANAGEEFEATIAVTLNSEPVGGVVDFEITYDDSHAEVSPQVATGSAEVHFDIVHNSAATDNVEHGRNVWFTEVDEGPTEWVIVEDGSFPSPSHAWFMADEIVSSDSSLVTPQFVVNNGTFSFTFKMKHSFEVSSGPTAYWDGGVLELTNNGGASWIDIGGSASPTYNGTIASNANSPIANRQAYVGTNTSYPNFNTVTVNLGSTYAGQTVQIRWRAVSDDNTGASGWWLDDIGFTTLATPLFDTLTSEPDICTSCFATIGDAIQAILVSSGVGEWPETANILNYVEDLGNICE